MSSYVGDKKALLCKADKTPARLYKGETKIDGWETQTKTGESVSFENTYNDTADVIISGNTVQSSDYHAVEGMSTQAQTVQGKNLFDKSAIILNHYINGATGLTVYAETTDCTDFITTLPNITYVISGNPNHTAQWLVWYNIDKNVISYITAKNGSVISPVNSHYFRLAIRKEDIDTYQLEVGSVATSYEPFVPNSPSPDYPSPIYTNLPPRTYKITTDEGIYEVAIAEELRGIGTVKDRIAFDKKGKKGWRENRIGQKVFDGTEDWTTTPTENQINTLRCSTGITSSLNLDVAIVSNFKRTPTATIDLELFYTGSFYIAIRVLRSRLSSDDLIGFKEWLSNNSTSIVYVLKTTIKTPLTFTKVVSSIAPELPTSFLTSTPSLDYPADVWDASGNMVSRGKNLFDLSKVNINSNVSLLPTGVKLTNGYNIFIGDASNWLKPNTTYYIHAEKNYNGKSQVNATGRISNLSYIGTLLEYSNTDGVFTTGSVVTGMLYFYGFASGVVDYTNVYIGTEPYVSYESHQEPNNISLPTLRKVGTVSDTYNPKTGILTKRISDWVILDGSLPWTLGGLGINHKSMYFDSITFSPNDDSIQMYKHDSTKLANINSDSSSFFTNGDQCFVHSPTGKSRLSVNNADSGMGFYSNSSSLEIKAYFYGWKMCNADGTAPYYKSEVPYTSSTWEEWVKGAGVVGDSSGMTLTSDNLTYIVSKIPMTYKTSTKYGIIYNVVVSTLTGALMYRPWVSADATGQINLSKNIGNNKLTMTTASTLTSTQFGIHIDVAEPLGNNIKLKDIRIFELPVGSQIETDFNTLTADELALKYTFNGLCVKNWKHVTDGLGQTAVLPTASYDGYTSYKMLYQLATQEEIQLTPTQIPTYYPTTIIETDTAIAKPVITSTVKVFP